MSNFFLKTKKEQYNCKQYKNLAEIIEISLNEQFLSENKKGTIQL